MTQVWDAQAYAKTGSFVPALGAGVLEWLDVQPGEKILDLGCGDGALTEKIVARGADVTALDASPEMLAKARERGLRAVLGNAERLLFAGEFDAVFSNAALHWVRDQDAMLTGVYRALKPGGRFVAEMGGMGNIAAIRVGLMAVLERHGCAGLEDGVNYYPAPDAYTKRLKRHGFTVERIELIPRPTPLQAGMRAWLETFRSGVIAAVPEPMRDRVLEETVALLEPALRDEGGNWTGDYVRLRFIART
ncbi:MAG TPA: methyltransferase domain-containing protein [Acidobacteriaceae bacterium]|nr:methyltransferase domain-containing protein [Acidobacteriaceae bacterium]